jgi:hypothetical protein
MNCKPHELAQIMSNFPDCDEAIGMIVRLGANTVPQPKSGAICWELQETLIVRDSVGLRYFIAIADDCLRPIRDPGDDAVDEIVQIVGAPNRDIVTSN